MNIYLTTLKTPLDLIATVLFLPLILILTIVISITIRISSGKNIIFRQERAGKNKQPFMMYKFRTMRLDVDPFGPSPKDGHDARLTKIGKLLRLTSLDELPQFLNVLKGEMSLVGPRPLYMSQAAQWNAHQSKRLNVKPGLTGLAQISGRGSLTIEDKLDLDVIYSEKITFFGDLRIVLSTFLSFLRSDNIYEAAYSKNEQTRGDAEKQS